MISRYLTVADVIAIHDLQIERFGGADGLRDLSALESALHRPQSGYYKDVIQEAAALWESLSQNHPFIDGNKRTAFVSTFIFLSFNNIEVLASGRKSLEFVIDCYENAKANYETFEEWLRANTKADQ